MKIKTLALTAAIAATGLFATSASAADGTITFTGNITSSTCSIDGNGSGTASFTVSLPKVGTSAFSTSSKYAGRTPFSINLTGCTATGTVQAYFEPGANVNASGRLSNTGGATGVDLQLLNDSQTAIDLNSQSGTTTATISSNAATLNYYVEYYSSTGTVGAGSVSSTVDYTIKYQ